MRQSTLALITVIVLMIAAGCTAAAPAAESGADTAPTEAPAEEATPTEEPAEESDEAGTEESSEDAAAGGEAATYTVDTEASTVEWFGSKPIGASEAGTVQIAEGVLNFNGSDLVDGTMVPMTCTCRTQLR